MTEREIGEIRRRLTPDKNSIGLIRGCFINEKKEIISEFNQSLGLISMIEAEEILALLKRTLSGTPNRNLLDIGFTTSQVADSDEHRLLSKLRNSSLTDDDAVREFFGKVASSLTIEGNYLILLAADSYDVPTFSKDGSKEDGSNEMFSYILCAVCPVKTPKSRLSYQPYDSTFKSVTAESVISAPDLGFMFPTFDNRHANIYNSLFYTRSISDDHSDFIGEIFKTEPPMPAGIQKDTFDTVIADSVAEDCSLDVVSAVHAELCKVITDHKESRSKEPLVVTKDTVTDILKNCGIPEEKVTAFCDGYEESFGRDAEICPKNIIDTGRFELDMPDVTIKVSPERSDLVETRIIDGIKYVLIRAEGAVEVNGINISIGE